MDIDKTIPDFYPKVRENYSWSTFKFSQNEVEITQWDHDAKNPQILDQFKIVKTPKSDINPNSVFSKL